MGATVVFSEFSGTVVCGIIRLINHPRPILTIISKTSALVKHYQTSLLKLTKISQNITKLLSLKSVHLRFKEERLFESTYENSVEPSEFDNFAFDLNILLLWRKCIFDILERKGTFLKLKFLTIPRIHQIVKGTILRVNSQQIIEKNQKSQEQNKSL